MNDAAALTELERRACERKRNEAEKKRLERRKKIRSGQFTPEFLDLLEHERQRREYALVLSTSFEGLPRNLSRMPIQSATITADVWFARECMSIRGERINPSSIARELIRTWPETYPAEGYHSLRQRTGSDLARVATLERLVIKGFPEPIWPRFNLSAALDELDQSSPYTA